eukprot:g8054.t1
MREACVLARDMLDLCCAMAQPGVTTDAIDAAVHAAIIEAGACPSPLNYHGFPKSVCSSVNEVACHAIPDDRPLQDGDLVSFDVSVFLNGFHGDNCATVGVGTIDAAGQRLMDATEEAMMQGVSVCRPGACLTEIGSAIHAVADHYGFDTVQKYCGHGVGSGFHMQPFVQHFRNNHQLELTPGMTFTIEPIFTEGSEATTLWRDAWTVQTVDGGRAAQFEHVVLITDEGHELAAAAWRRNLKNGGATVNVEETERRKAERKAERKAKRKAERKETRKIGDPGRSNSRKKKRKRSGRGERTARSRSVSMGSVDSLGRQRLKRRRSRSSMYSDSNDDRSDSSARRYRRRRRRRQRRSGIAMMVIVMKGGEAGAALAAAGGGVVPTKTAIPDGVVVVVLPRRNSRRRIGLLGTLGSTEDVPSDPHRPEHDDRGSHWRGGNGAWKQAGVSMGIMGTGTARGRGARGGSASEIASASASFREWERIRRQGRDRDRDRDRGRSRGRSSSSRGRKGKGKMRSRSPGDRKVARSLSRSISRDRRIRWDGRSHSPSYRKSRSWSRSRSRSRSRNKAVSGLLQEIMRKGSRSRSPCSRRRDGSAKPWTHDLYEEIAGADSPPRPSLPPGYKPEPESWVSRAGGVYVPLKPT